MCVDGSGHDGGRAAWSEQSLRTGPQGSPAF